MRSCSMDSLLLTSRYTHIVGGYLEDYNVSSLADVNSDQMNTIIEKIFCEYCTGLTTVESAEQDSVIFCKTADMLKACRLAEIEMQKNFNIRESVAKMSDEELVDKFKDADWK